MEIGQRVNTRISLVPSHLNVTQVPPMDFDSVETKSKYFMVERKSSSSSEEAGVETAPRPILNREQHSQIRKQKKGMFIC